jgi:hypothetical protein
LATVDRGDAPNVLRPALSWFIGRKIFVSEFKLRVRSGAKELGDAVNTVCRECVFACPVFLDRGSENVAFTQYLFPRTRALKKAIVARSRKCMRCSKGIAWAFAINPRASATTRCGCRMAFLLRRRDKPSANGALGSASFLLANSSQTWLSYLLQCLVKARDRTPGRAIAVRSEYFWTNSVHIPKKGRIPISLPIQPL